MPKNPRSQRNYESGPGGEGRKQTGTAYTEGWTIEELQEQYLKDSAELEAEDMMVRYGRDIPRFLEDNELHHPTSFHLRSPWFVNPQNRMEFTPQRAPTTDVLYARIPHSAALMIHGMLRRGEDIDVGSDQMVGVLTFPEGGDEIILKRIHRPPKGHKFSRAQLEQHKREEPLRAVVQECVRYANQTASAKLVLMSPLNVGSL